MKNMEAEREFSRDSDSSTEALLAVNLSEKDSLILSDICEKANKTGELSLDEAKQIVRCMINFCYMNDRIGGYSSGLVLRDEEIDLYANDVFNAFKIRSGSLGVKEGQIGLFKGEHPIILGIVNWKDGFDTSEMISELQKLGENYFDSENRETFLVSENYIIGNYQKYRRLGVTPFTTALQNINGEDILSNHDMEYECSSRGENFVDVVYVNSKLGLKYFCSKDEYGNGVVEPCTLRESASDVIAKKK